MKRIKMTSFSIRFPWIIIGLALAVTVFFGAQFPKVSFDNDPENMLAEDEPIRVFHNRVKAQYNLYDFVIVGIVNDTDEDGIFNVGTLGRIDALTHELDPRADQPSSKCRWLAGGGPRWPAVCSGAGTFQCLEPGAGQGVRQRCQPLV